MKNQELNRPETVAQSTQKKTYSSPSLKHYGAIHLTTQGSGAVNGDGGMGMMP